MQNNFSKDAIRWQISKHVKAVSRIFMLVFTINAMLTFQTFDLEKVGQGHSLQISQRVSFGGNGKYQNL